MGYDGYLKYKELQTASVMRAKAASPYARRNLVGGVQDQMQSKLKVQSRSLGTAVENRDLVKEALDQDAASKEDLEVQRFTANSSPTIRKRTAVTSVALPRAEEISQTYADEGYDSDDSDINGAGYSDESNPATGGQRNYRRRVQIENFMTMQKKKRSDTSARKKLALEKEDGYGSTKGMRFTRRRQVTTNASKTCWKFDLMTTGTDNDDDVSSIFTLWRAHSHLINKYPP